MRSASLPRSAVVEPHSSPLMTASLNTRFGWIAAAASDRGLFWLSLHSTKEEGSLELTRAFAEVELRPEQSLASTLTALVAHIEGELPQAPALALDLAGSPFALRVWQAIATIPRGQTRSYGQLAAMLGSPRSIRAVARACGANRLSLAIPCHRVIGASGALTGYRWGIERKRLLLTAEGALV